MIRALAALSVALPLLAYQPVAMADVNDVAISNCLKAWGQHPFGAKPRFRVLASSVKVFGIGQSVDDTAITKGPDLVLIDTGVNVMGGNTLQLLNPNGWYCFANNVNVMGSLTIKAHCNAHIAAASNGMTFMGGDPSNKSTTVLGGTSVESVGCR
jgi:hypothetical protein